ncbi:claudin-8-like [Triplophysa rosa]|uniref:Claudin 17 n=1 Tax=Triplophysa rosa TaxID=992332 RepID=A0A9W7TPC3_TRIRA|nr:claudin-8-like [Triplophysa rosa]KAI7800855.1 putative claudin 17 [Triplophysa rosa]
MVQGKCELIALCLGIIGLIGTAAVTALPMWKVTAFIGENIIVMEVRWEGLWMTCFRQANIHMQCKVYDSLLFLPPDLQAARGLTCCALALSGLGLLVSLVGLRCTSCLRDQPRVKSIIVMAVGAMQILASFCVIIPVSWTAHTIIRDFYNPLLINAQRRELGEALYIGWVTSAFLLASGVIFLCRRVGPHSDLFYVYQPGYSSNKHSFNHSPPLINSSVRDQPLLQNNSFSIYPSVRSFTITPPFDQHLSYGGRPMTTGPLVYHQNTLPPQNTNVMQYLHQTAQYPDRLSTHFTGSNVSNPYSSCTSGSALQIVPQKQLFIGYNYSRVQSHSSDSGSGLRI